MSWRVVTISSQAKLDYKMDYLVVRTRDSTKRIHLSEISVLVLESTAISMTAYLLCELSKRKIDILFCDEKRLPYGILQPLYGSHDTSSKVRTQIRWTSDIKNIVWEEIVRAKIVGQIAILKKMKKDSAALLLETYLPNIQPADSTNREGHAAKVYFNALFGKDFSRVQENMINAALNYGYSIFLSVVARDIVASGYITQLGLFHDNMFNPLNLACDLMEPFRPFVDWKVSQMHFEKFEHEEKMELIKTLNITVTIDGTEQYMLRAIRIFCKSVFDSINEKDVSMLRIPGYEL